MPARSLAAIVKIAGWLALAFLGLWIILSAGTSAPSWLVEHRLACFSSPHYDIRCDPRQFSRETLEAFAAERERVLRAEASRLDLAIPSIHLRVVLYSDFDAERAASGDKRPYAVEGTTIFAVVAGYLHGLDPAADAAALLNATWGPPGSQLLGQWVAAWLAAEPPGRALEEAAAQIESEVGHYPLAELGEQSSDGFLSPLVRTPLGTAWIEWVADRFGLSAVRKIYSAEDNREDQSQLADLLGTTPARLELDWKQWTAQLRTKFSPRVVPRRTLPDDFFFRGVSLSHEGWAGHGGGYASRAAAEQIRRLHEMGANAIALVPYGFTRAPQAPTLSYTGTDETDVDLSEAAYVAHQLGMKVMLKPQLWVHGGRFTGEIRFTDTAARDQWMRYYREFILHYARLAEQQHMDLLSVGNELGGVTPNEQDWRRLIADVRRVFHGPITYAANWSGEFDAVRFWDALDYAGLNDYYPLANAPSTRAEDLQPGAEALARKLAAFSQKWHRPVLFTEVGYPSVRGAAVEPWVEDEDRPLSLDEQAACYQAVFRAFIGQPWFRGMFWWKWRSDGRGGGPHAGSYTPMGKPAAQVIRRWYARLAAQSVSPRSPAR